MVMWKIIVLHPGTVPNPDHILGHYSSFKKVSILCILDIRVYDIRINILKFMNEIWTKIFWMNIFFILE